MAFGPQTPLLQQALLTLMQGRSPSPLAPAPAPPISTPPSFAPPPEPAPVAPAPALDQDLIAQLTGPRPVAPVAQPVPLIQKIANALIGFSAGTQGYGPQFLAQLQEQRERPQREFRAANEQYQARKIRATEFAAEKQQREQADIQRRADIQSDREFKTWLQKTGVTDEMAIQQMRQAFDLEKQRQAERIAKERADELEQKQLKLKAADIAKAYRLAGAGQYSNELAERDLGLRDKVSTGADKWLSAHVQLEQARANKIAGVGGGTGGGGDAASLERQFNALKAQFLRAEKPTQTAPYGDRALQSKIAAQYPAIMNKLAKLGYEVGFDPSGIYPYIKPPQGRGAPPTAQALAPQSKQGDSLGIR